MAYNLRNSDFVELFGGEEILKPHLARQRQSLDIQEPTRQPLPAPVRGTQLPMLALAVLVVGYIYFKLG